MNDYFLFWLHKSLHTRLLLQLPIYVYNLWKDSTVAYLLKQSASLHLFLH